jgi:hypothetical protein
LKLIGVQPDREYIGGAETQPPVKPVNIKQDLEGLFSIARFTDQIWPVPAERARRGFTRSALRDLGAPQVDVKHGFSIGSRLRIAIESEIEGHLLLLDKGTTGKIYCLCPSHFAPDTRLQKGLTYLPQERSHYDAFAVTGNPGREQLLAIVTNEPLNIDWMPTDTKTPARVLDNSDIATMLTQLQKIDGDKWVALSTYFDVII